MIVYVIALTVMIDSIDLDFLSWAHRRRLSAPTGEREE